jgi:chemotaxis protein methyltransferase CheR
LELLKLTASEFQRIAKVVYEKTGIHLPPEKLSMLSNRLRKRLRALNLESFEDYYKLICSKQGCEEELPHFLSAVTTNETYFFRNEQLWKFFTTDLIQHFVATKGKTRSLRVWSAASSSGEEAYTAAIALREHLPDCRRWNVAIIGSDISNRVLDHARAGIYNDYAVSRMSPDQLDQWFVKQDGAYHLKDEIRKMVKFVFHNLREDLPEGRFDLIFLRNVLMYFDLEMKKRVLQVVTKALAPGGYLIVGDVDPIRTVPELSKCMTLEYKRPGAYQKPLPQPAATAGREQLVQT